MKAEVDIIAFPIEGDDLRILKSEQHGETTTKKETGRTRDNETNSAILAPGEYLEGTRFKAHEETLQSLNFFFPGKINGPQLSFPKIRLSNQDINRWKMAWHAIQVFDEGFGDVLRITDRDIIKSRCKDWPDFEDIFYEFPVAFGFSVAGFIYGGLHALAWFAHFDSSTEQLLWRISACVVMSGLPIMYVHAKVMDHLNIFRHISIGIESISYYFLVVLLVSVLLAYILARAYLVVECFINVSHLPAGVYDVPSWAAYFPHIS